VVIFLSDPYLPDLICHVCKTVCNNARLTHGIESARGLAQSMALRDEGRARRSASFWTPPPQNSHEKIQKNLFSNTENICASPLALLHRRTSGKISGFLLPSVWKTLSCAPRESLSLSGRGVRSHLFLRA
jgi:hypothetical protein